MKKIYFIFFAMLPLFLSAQFNEWKSAYAISDSSHNNRNACLYGQSNFNILFWEKDMDASTTQLSYKIISNSQETEKIALNLPGVKLTNPKIFDRGNGSQPPDFMVFYQTNEGADIDLKYITYKSDGTFSEPKPLSTLPGDDVNLAISTNNVNIVAWQNGNKIWVSRYDWQNDSFMPAYAIDSTGANTPGFVYGSGGLICLKNIGDSTELINIGVTYDMNVWIIIHDESKHFPGAASSLTTGGFMDFNTYCMQNKIGSNPSGLIVKSTWGDEFQFLNSPSFNYTQPAISDYTIGVKGPNDMYILAFISDSLGQQELFGETPISNGLTNISNWSGEDRNPKMFKTFYESYIIRVNLFWESIRQGFSTIYGTHYDYLFGGITDNTKSENIKASPSPFNRETTISFEATEITPVTIYDLQGREIKAISSSGDKQGWQKAVWDGTNSSGNIVSPGSYVIVAKTVNGFQSRIVIKD